MLPPAAIEMAQSNPSGLLSYLRKHPSWTTEQLDVVPEPRLCSDQYGVLPAAAAVLGKSWSRVGMNFSV
jgi:hypothetical protein